MSTRSCDVCGKVRPTSECINVIVQYECPCCDKEEAKVKEEKCVCPACERELACKEEEFREKCQQPPVCVPEIELEAEDTTCDQSYPNMRAKEEDKCTFESDDECPPCPCAEIETPKAEIDFECPSRCPKTPKKFCKEDPCKLCQLEEDEDKRVGAIRANHTAEKRRKAEEKRQAEIRRLEEKRRCEEEKCMAELRKEFMEQCVKEKQAQIAERRAELEKCRELEKQVIEECCEPKADARKCEEECPNKRENECKTSWKCGCDEECPTKKENECKTSWKCGCDEECPTKKENECKTSWKCGCDEDKPKVDQCSYDKI